MWLVIHRKKTLPDVVPTWCTFFPCAALFSSRRRCWRGLCPESTKRTARVCFTTPGGWCFLGVQPSFKSGYKTVKTDVVNPKINYPQLLEVYDGIVFFWRDTIGMFDVQITNEGDRRNQKVQITSPVGFREFSRLPKKYCRYIYIYIYTFVYDTIWYMSRVQLIWWFKFMQSGKK